MTGSTMTGFDAFLKDNYTTDEVARVVNQDHVFLDMLDTKKRGTGRRWIVPLIDGQGQGAGSTVAGAQAAAEQTGTGGNITGIAWTINWGDYSAHVDIGDKVIDASASDVGAFFEDQREEINGIYRQFADIMSSYLLRSAGHYIGNCTSAQTPTSGVVTLANPSDIVNFERGMLLVASTSNADDGTGTAVGSGAIGYVVAVDYNAGSFSVAATSGGAAANPTGWGVASLFFFRNTDFMGTGTGSGQRIVLGYGAWNPSTSPAATSFEGVDRSVNPLRRSGVRLTTTECSGLGIEARCKKLATRMASRGFRPKKALLHPEQFQALADSLEVKGVRNIDGGGKEQVGTFSFNRIMMATGAGDVSFFSERYMPIDAVYEFDPDGIRFATLSGFPKVVNGDGLTMLRKATENTYEYRLVAYPAYCHRNPAMTGRAPLVVPS